MDTLHTVTLTGGGPWGIRIQGGKDFNSPLAISRVVAGGKGEDAGVLTGESILEINGQSTKDLVHVMAQKLIKNTGFNLSLTLDRSTGRKDVTNLAPPPPKVALVSASQFTPLIKPVTAKPFTAQPYTATKQPTFSGIKSSFPPPPPEPVGNNVVKAESFPAPPPESFPAPPPVKQVVKHIPKGPSIIDRPSVLAPKQEITSKYTSPTMKPVLPKQTSPSSINSVTGNKVSSTFHLPPKAPTQTSSAKLMPLLDTKSLEDELSGIKLANDPNGRKFISPTISPVRPPNVQSKVAEVVGPSGSVVQSSRPNPIQNTPVPKNVIKPNQPIAQHQKRSNQKTTSDLDTKAPVCTVCNENIRGKYCQAIGKDWHPECFKCQSSDCEASLQATGFIEDAGNVFCRHCFERDIAHTCAKCNRKIIGDVMHALNQTWHMTCFVCVKCNKTFQDGIFHWQNEQPYCVDDYNSLFATFCRGCSLRVEAGDQYIEALGGSWHDNCFTCATCHIDLRNNGFYNRNNMPVCKAHAR